MTRVGDTQERRHRRGGELGPQGAQHVEGVVRIGQVGVHDVHYAMVVILAMGIGLFAPPFGVGYYAACAISRIHPNEGMKPIVGYMVALFVGVVVVAAAGNENGTVFGITPTVDAQSPNANVWYNHFGSAHPSGTNFVLADGSVRAIPYEIDSETFRRLSHRGDKLKIDAF